MKEFKFNDEQWIGQDDKNISTQLDNFEPRGSWSLTVRHIFDFSYSKDKPIDALITLDLPEYNYYGERTISNLVPYGDTLTFYKGNPYNCLFMVNDVPVYNLGQNYPSNQHIFNYQDDVSGTRKVPYWNQEVMLNTDNRAEYVLDDGYFTAMKNFRSGFIDFSLKTDKANTFIGLGTTFLRDFGAIGAAASGPDVTKARATVNPKTNVVLDSKDSYITQGNAAGDILSIGLNNGKLELTYTNAYGAQQRTYTILGNANLADNQWHHVVINFNKPGTIEVHGKRINKKFIEFWVDGQLDKKDDQINTDHSFFPLVEWLLMDPILATQIDQEGWESYDYFSRGGQDRYPNSFLGNNEFERMALRDFNPIAFASAFRGSLGHWSDGVAAPLNRYQIQQRYKLFKFNEKVPEKAFIGNATFISPTITTNKKKALKLFWNNLINDLSVDGLELDDTYSVESYSVTHKTLNSKTEINNIDLCNSKDITFLQDVRVAIKEPVMIWGIGKESAFNRPEVYTSGVGEQLQLNAADPYFLDAVYSVDPYTFIQSIKPRLSTYTPINLAVSGVSLVENDRILLTNQYLKSENGVYVFKDLNSPLVRASDANSATKLENAVVSVVDGYYKDTSWILSNKVFSLRDVQNWIELEYHPNSEDVLSQPIFGSRWSDNFGNERFINLEEDVNIANYDLIVFMNYPKTTEDVSNHFIDKNLNQVKIAYDSFITSIKNVTAQGASLYVSSARLAQDLGIVSKFTQIDQLVQASDAQSASINPFEISEPSSNYFDTHRINNYRLTTEVAGLTDKETYILTDFINYISSNKYEYEQYHAKYSYRQLGLKIDNEFIIPGLSLRKSITDKTLPGFVQNQKLTSSILAVAPADIIVGTVITKLSNNYYNGSTPTDNPYKNYATTIIVHNNQVLGTQPITGKIFVNCVEDGYTFSREKYNKASIQVLPDVDSNETTGTRGWQYSTKRLNRKPKQINIRELTKFGQTIPTTGGGGALIQAPSNASSGIIRSKSDSLDTSFESDLYSELSEERYSIQEIPVLSMTWLGLQWLAT